MGVIKDILRTMDYGPSPESSEHVGAWLEEQKSWPPGRTSLRGASAR
jgi:hypothetical protein